MSVKPLRARQAEATRSLLIAVARESFTEHGYAATSIDDIIQHAGVARGALYHHFSGKEALFRAVYESVEHEVVARVMVELPMLRTVLTPLLGTTTFDGIAIDALAHVALGGLYGAALYIARAPDPRAARADIDDVLDTLVTGLLRPSAD